MIRIHNSMTGSKEPLREIEPGHLRMYVCGITVYDYCHIGHARMLVVFDMVRRYLLHRGFRVTFVRNITDIDDKIIDRAARNGEPVAALTARYIAAMNEDCAALGILPPDHEPRATEYLPDIIAMVQRLIDAGYAYVASDGDVLYAVAKFDGYGRLSGKRLADLRAGARVEIDTAKRDPLDFVLWKASKPGEPMWDSPWGPGRPGWHIECSAMSTALLGAYFDIHGGGMDLKFPHHENEIAQSCAAYGTPFVRLWMHNGFVNVDDEKMSKSLGNFFTVRDVQATLKPEVLRFFVLSSHYRGPINYSAESLAQARAGLERLYIALRGVVPAVASVPDVATGRFHESMDDDFNTPEAIAVLQSLATEINRAKAAGEIALAAERAAELKSLAGVLNVVMLDPEDWLKSAQGAPGASVAADGSRPGEAQIDALIEARVAARKARNFAESDRIRDELTAQGVVIEDGPQGTRWRWR